ncbi:MAG: hypothetical protein JWP09_653 [Candidatus Taylorbacteria bacterium]|nr:hypothetical protein [Candidatus Taylorbacteria bacterium]
MFRLILSYFIWHYTQAFKDIFNLFRNFAWFVYHFFSIKVLSKTLFSPWRKLNESYEKGWNLNAFFETLVVNFIMRIVGFLVRLFIILTGIISLAFVSIVGATVFIAWIFLPFIITLLFVSSLRLLI